MLRSLKGEGFLGRHLRRDVTSKNRASVKGAEPVVSLAQPDLPSRSGSDGLPSLPEALWDPTTGTLRFEAFAAEFSFPPTDIDNYDWNRLGQALSAMNSLLASGAVRSVVDRHGEAWPAIAQSGSLEASLLTQWCDPAKAKAIQAVFTQATAGLGDRPTETLRTAIEDHMIFIGKNNANARKIFAADKRVRSRPGRPGNTKMQSAIERFFRELESVLTSAEQPAVSVEAQALAILYHKGGGGHLAAAEALAGDLSGRVDIKTLNVGEVEGEDSISRTLGLSYQEFHNLAGAQAGQSTVTHLKGDTAVLLNEFLALQEPAAVRAHCAGAKLAVSTGHWREHASLVADEDIPVVLQICDYGTDVPLGLRSLAEKVVEYDLDGIHFLLPSATAQLESPATGIFRRIRKPRQTNLAEETHQFHLTEYPVGGEWTKPLSGQSIRKVEAQYRLNPGEKRVCAMMGSQGGRRHFTRLVQEFVSEFAARLKEGEELPNTQLFLVCGKDATSRREMPGFFAETLRSVHAQYGIPMETLEGQLSINVQGFVPNQDLAILARTSDAVVTKPGGSTSAELIAAGVKEPILLMDDSLPWEMGNAAELASRVGAHACSATDSLSAPVLNRLVRGAQPRATDNFDAASDVVFRLADRLR